MTRWQKFGLAGALVAAAGVGMTFAPVAHSQTVWADGESQIVELFGGGSRIGISVKDVEAEDVKRGKLATPSGVLVTEVHDDTPAATAGFKSGDVIAEFDGERVRSARQFTRLVQETPAGRQVQAVVMRDGQRVTLTVTPRESRGPRVFDKLRDLEDYAQSYRYEHVPMPPGPPARPAPPRQPPRVPEFDSFFGRSSSRLGISVDDLSDQLAAYFGTKEGVLVTTVRDDSVAAKAGIKAGDVITAVNGSPIESPSDLRRRLQEVEDGGEVTIALVRDRKPMTVKGKLEPREERRRTYRSIV